MQRTLYNVVMHPLYHCTDPVQYRVQTRQLTKSDPMATKKDESGKAINYSYTRLQKPYTQRYGSLQGDTGGSGMLVGHNFLGDRG